MSNTFAFIGGKLAGFISDLNIPVISEAAARKRDELNRKRLVRAHVRGGVMQALDRAEHNMAVDAKKAAKRERQATRRKERGDVLEAVVAFVAFIAVIFVIASASLLAETAKKGETIAQRCHKEAQ